MTAEEIRKKIIEVTLKNGGHLASSLGAVELAMALSEVFDPQHDRIVWDVGHQAYAWKILTGRAENFDTLRKFNGVSGFPNPKESAADAAVAGHAGVSISVAEGLAAARDLRGSSEHVIAVVGDAALANGTAFEALNNCTGATTKVIVVINDNGMSISRPVGGVSRLLAKLITGVRYNRVKMAAERAGHRLHLTFLRGIYHRIESRIKSFFLGNFYFERFGLRYIGPVDGHDLRALTAALTVAKEDKRSVVVHVFTKKGKGYAPAEVDPTRYHGISPSSNSPAPKPADWSATFGEALVNVARRNERVVALTAAMRDGTGLKQFWAEFPQRAYDVGIAEGHMTAFAAGLAAGGARPVVAIYSTFLQRAVDQLMHDVCISALPVVMCVDRAGVVGADGVTHQGLYDVAMTRCLPNLTIAQPKDAEDLAALLDEALARHAPTLIRYGRGAAPHNMPVVANPAAHIQIWATGDWVAKANQVAAAVGAGVVYARYIKPFDAALLAKQRAAGQKIVCLENASRAGGLGEALAADLIFAWPDEFIPHGTPAELEKAYGLDVESIITKIRETL